MKVQDFIHKFSPCKKAAEWLAENNIKSLKKAWETCERSDWMIWALHALKFDDKMVWVKLAVASAKRVLPIYEKRQSSDAPRKAIEVAEAWIIDPTEENRMKCKAADAAAYAAAAAFAAADAAAAFAAAAAYAAADAAAAYAGAYAAYAAYAANAAYAAADAAERKEQAEIIRSLVSWGTVQQLLKEGK